MDLKCQCGSLLPKRADKIKEHFGIYSEKALEKLGSGGPGQAHHDVNMGKLRGRQETLAANVAFVETQRKIFDELAERMKTLHCSGLP